ncbi:hypothetical protein DFH06DRAFT_1151360 [Mycena polygramma]|nr:hypothetical protein DFH06DRAFT_1151360 [Mycena polygramma]
MFSIFAALFQYRDQRWRCLAKDFGARKVPKLPERDPRDPRISSDFSLSHYAPPESIPVVGSHKEPRRTVFKSVGTFRLRNSRQLICSFQAVDGLLLPISLHSPPLLFSSRPYRSATPSSSPSIAAVTPPSLPRSVAVTAPTRQFAVDCGAHSKLRNGVSARHARATPQETRVRDVRVGHATYYTDFDDGCAWGLRIDVADSGSLTLCEFAERFQTDLDLVLTFRRRKVPTDLKTLLLGSLWLPTTGIDSGGAYYTGRACTHAIRKETEIYQKYIFDLKKVKVANLQNFTFKLFSKKVEVPNFTKSGLVLPQNIIGDIADVWLCCPSDGISDPMHHSPWMSFPPIHTANGVTEKLHKQYMMVMRRSAGSGLSEEPGLTICG